MDSVPRTQADVLGLPLLEGLGGGDEGQVVQLTGGEGGAVWRSANMESLTLVHSYNLPPPSQQEVAEQQEAARLLMDQCNQHLVQEKSQSDSIAVNNLDETSIISFKRPIFYEGLHHLYSSGE